ncbi:MAG: cytochrome c3 family protein [bacterium]
MGRFLLALALLIAPAPVLAQAAASPFPHARHAKLFPLCSSCHVGITIADPFRAFPSPSLCADCHDGIIKPRVKWEAPRKQGPGLLVFTHQQHAASTKGVACESCHALRDSLPWMNVSAATPERCMSCHTQGRSAHLADATVCSTCHRTLVTATALSDARIAALPKPASHARTDFVAAHGAAARATTANCATCHARESCTRCHVDGARQPAIRALGTDARVARLAMGRGAEYPTPADHRSARFALLHGASARSNTARCATCHARPSCESCHTGEGARDILARIPDAREATAPGVQLRHVRAAGAPDLRMVANVTAQSMPQVAAPPLLRHDTTRVGVRVHAAGFARAHGAQAASGASTCASCHAQRFCSDCHTGERVTHRYHKANFVSTHAPQAYSRETDCASCHSTEAFCRDCHRQTGLAAATNIRSTVFHNAQPQWLLQHGRAARQDLKACATCHQQSYCMQCHSDLGSRISPHGPDFDAVRMSSKNPRLCLTCHFKNPLTR